jgi:F-type H+-transporting ATPase subunit a
MFLFAEESAEHTPLIVWGLNQIDKGLGSPLYHFEKDYTQKYWNDYVFTHFGTTAEKMFGPYTPENAVPWYTVMFVIACLLTVVVIYLFKGKLSEDDPRQGQMTLEAGFLALRDMVVSVIGEHGVKYFPVVATFAVLVLISNLMGQFPLFMSPTASVNVTFALSITSFIYYNWVGIHENGIVKHLGHLTGPKLPLLLTFIITPLIFGIELISNLIRPFTLGLRLFANMFADEQISSQVANLYAPYTQFLLPVVLMPLAVFVAFVQTLVFTLLSMIYISEVSHPPHDDHDYVHETHEPDAATVHA